ncbi:hypothetical protein CUJ87_32465 (plasmid) [Paraburkholderia caledonica]|nr:hypothetical protein CUJ87_32465 [Paraburkholderia caledonica]
MHLLSDSANRTGCEPEHDTVRVVADASGRRAIVESVDEHRRKLRSTVKWINLVSLTSHCSEPDGCSSTFSTTAAT